MRMSTPNTLLITPVAGIFWLIFLFLFCFFGVHIAKLAKLGRKYQRQQDGGTKTDKPDEKNVVQKEQNAQQKPSPPQSAGEPIYYIVERKRRSKSSFSPPKEIKFK